MRIVTVKQLSEILGVSEWTIRDAVRKGELPHFRTRGKRGHIRFDLDEVLVHLRGANPKSIDDLTEYARKRLMIALGRG